MNRKIRLLQITHDLAIGGLQQVVVNICRTIDRERFEISVLCLRELGEYTEEVEKMGIKVTLIPQKENGTDYFSFFKIASHLKKEKIDVIHTHNTQPFVEGTIAAKLVGIKSIIHTDHARNFPDKKRYMFAEWVASMFAFKVIGVSEHTSYNLNKYEKISKHKIATILNGIDGRKYSIEIDKKIKKKEIGIKENGIVIGLCVRLSEQKGITYLISAMPKILEVIPDLTLVIVGDGELRENLEREAVENKVSQSIIFTGSRLDVNEMLKVFDIYVLPSLWEGLPMGIIEAMAAGCPIIATDVGGVKMAITNGVNGTLVQSKNVSMLANAIIKLANDNEVRNKYIDQSLRIFTEKFSAAQMTAKYEELYIEALSGNKTI